MMTNVFFLVPSNSIELQEILSLIWALTMSKKHTFVNCDIRQGECGREKGKRGIDDGALYGYYYCYY